MTSAAVIPSVAALGQLQQCLALPLCLKELFVQCLSFLCHTCPVIECLFEISRRKPHFFPSTAIQPTHAGLPLPTPTNHQQVTMYVCVCVCARVCGLTGAPRELGRYKYSFATSLSGYAVYKSPSAALVLSTSCHFCDVTIGIYICM